MGNYAVLCNFKVDGINIPEREVCLFLTRAMICGLVWTVLLIIFFNQTQGYRNFPTWEDKKKKNKKEWIFKVYTTQVDYTA